MTANTPSSRKQKGRKFQQQIRDLILENFPELEPDDVRSTSMGASGVDLLISPKCQELFPFAVECKNQEKINIWKSIEQAEKNSISTLIPVLFFRKNRTKTYVTLQSLDFFKLLKIINFLTNGDNKNSSLQYLYKKLGEENDYLQDNKSD